MKALVTSCVVIVSLALGALLVHEKMKRETAPHPFFVQDLTSYGFPTDSHDEIMLNFTDVNFLSDNLVLVSVNTRVYGPVERTDADTPLSKLVLLDLSRKAVIKTSDFPVEKRSGSIKRLNDGRFVLLNQSGVNFCSQTLDCRKAIDGPDPILVSPKGSRITVGGNGQTPQRLFETDSLKELDEFPSRGPSAVPGDDGILLWKEEPWSKAHNVSIEGKMYVRMPDHSERQLPLLSYSIGLPDARFLSDKEVGGFLSEDSLAVVRIDGTILYKKPVAQIWSLNEIVTTASGSRFCFREAGYTTLNSILNFLDIEKTRPYNRQTITVFDTESGRPEFKSEWDPRPYVGPLGSPALSPDGQELAVMHGSSLEVYRIP
jgi:hypothetical protein